MYGSSNNNNISEVLIHILAIRSYTKHKANKYTCIRNSSIPIINRDILFLNDRVFLPSSKLSKCDFRDLLLSLSRNSVERHILSYWQGLLVLIQVFIRHKIILQGNFITTSRQASLIRTLRFAPSIRNKSKSSPLIQCISLKPRWRDISRGQP